VLGGDADRGVRTIRKAIDAGGSQPFYHKALGWALLRAGDKEGAKAALAAGMGGKTIKSAEDLPDDVDQWTAAFLSDAVSQKTYVTHWNEKNPELAWFYVAEKADIAGDREAAYNAYVKSIHFLGIRKTHRTAGWAAYRLRKFGATAHPAAVSSGDAQTPTTHATDNGSGEKN
jgi:hypothetical protein